MHCHKVTSLAIAYTLQSEALLRIQQKRRLKPIYNAERKFSIGKMYSKLYCKFSPSQNFIPIYTMIVSQYTVKSTQLTNETFLTTHQFVVDMLRRDLVYSSAAP